MKRNQKFMAQNIIVAIFCIFLLLACTPIPPVTPGEKPVKPTSQTTSLKAETGEVTFKKFASTNELLDYIETSQKSSGYYPMGGSGIRRFAMMESAAAPVASKAADSGRGSAATDYSSTNIQVQGVDEADFVKNDGKYIYTLSNQKLVIVDAYPAEDATILSITDLEGDARQLFINGDKLIVFVQKWEEDIMYQPYEPIPQPRGVSKLHILVFDISNKEKPVQKNDFTISGDYFQSRMIGNLVYFVAKDPVYYYQRAIDIPVIMDAKMPSLRPIRPDIFYFGNPESEYVFHTVASLDLDTSNINAKTFMMGYSDSLYVSEDNLYLSYKKNVPYKADETQKRFFEIVVPLLPSEVQSQIKAISSGNERDDWKKISEILNVMYTSMDKNSKEQLVKRINEATDEYEFRKAQERDTTIIHKIALANGKLDYVAFGAVPGSLLNQFSYDENNGNLRVATTTRIWAREPIVHNNVYVLDKSMKLIGQLEGIAKGEQIYSTRFLGDRLYMVTFLRTDPLFVIDLSNPTLPKILGELKIPGFSDYLHPYDATHLIGVGKETQSNDWGGVSTKGVKVALFDVSDVNNPKQIDTLEIGDAGSDSEALRDHKAFLFSKEKDLLVLPITEVKRQGKMYNYDERVDAAYVFRITEKGINLLGNVVHNKAKEQYWWYSPNTVRRSLYMDNVLYTISSKSIKMNDLENLKDIKTIDLPKEQIANAPAPYAVETLTASGAVK